MLIITIVRWAIFAIFLLLCVYGIVGFFLARRFYRAYVQKHRELKVRVEAVERRLKILESL